MSQKSPKKIAAPVTWFGSKSRYVKSIVKEFPEHQTFVDVFGGSGAILLGKKPSKVEVYNDINSKMSSLFKVLSDDKKTKELVRRLELTPYSREYFKECQGKLDSTQDEIELAKLMIVVQRQSHGGLAKQWSYCIDAPAGGYSASVRKFHAGIERLPEIHKRIRKVQIENSDFSDLIPRYDRSRTLFYLDPPYVPETRVDGSYEYEMTIGEHEALVSLVLSCDGMFILSGYQSYVYEPLEAAGWKRLEIETIASTSRNRSKRVECLWLSPNCQVTDKLERPKDIQSDDSLTERQKAAYSVHRKRTQESEAKIKSAINSLKRTGRRISKAEVSRMTGLSREHISRHYSSLF